MDMQWTCKGPDRNLSEIISPHLLHLSSLALSCTVSDRGVRNMPALLAPGGTPNSLSNQFVFPNFTKLFLRTKMNQGSKQKKGSTSFRDFQGTCLGTWKNTCLGAKMCKVLNILNCDKTWIFLSDFINSHFVHVLVRKHKSTSLQAESGTTSTVPVIWSGLIRISWDAARELHLNYAHSFEHFEIRTKAVFKKTTRIRKNEHRLLWKAHCWYASLSESWALEQSCGNMRQNLGTLEPNVALFR